MKASTAYYILRECPTGSAHAFPQVVGVSDREVYDRVREIFNRPVSSTPDLEFMVDENGLLTDFIAQSYLLARCLIVSPRAWNIINGFKLSEDIVCFPVKVDYRDKLYEYHMILPTRNRNEDLDYVKTQFLIKDRSQNIIRETRFNSAIDMAQKSMNLRTYPVLQAKDNILYVKNEISQNDMFFISIGKADIYVSEELGLRLVNEGLTGFEINFGSKYMFEKS